MMIMITHAYISTRPALADRSEWAGEVWKQQEGRVGFRANDSGVRGGWAPTTPLLLLLLFRTKEGKESTPPVWTRASPEHPPTTK